MAELAGVDLNRGPGIERPPNTLRHGLIPDATDARVDLPGPCLTGQPDLQGLHAPTQGAANKHCPKELPPVIVHAAREPRPALLIGHGGLP